MASLYEISSEYLTAIENTFDHETGEINENAVKELDKIEKNINEKSVSIASYIKNIEAESNAIINAVISMKRRVNHLENKMSYLNDYLKSNMERCGINEIKSPYFVLKLKKCPVSVILLNEELIPSHYKKVTKITSIDKTKIKQDLLDGRLIQGATLKANLRLEIK